MGSCVCLWNCHSFIHVTFNNTLVECVLRLQRSISNPQTKHREGVEKVGMARGRECTFWWIKKEYAEHSVSVIFAPCLFEIPAFFLEFLYLQRPKGHRWKDTQVVFWHCVSPEAVVCACLYKRQRFILRNWLMGLRRLGDSEIFRRGRQAGHSEKTYSSRPKVVAWLAEFLLSQGTWACFLLRSSADWMRPSHLKGSLLYSHSTN